MSTTTGFSSRPGRAPDTHLKPARPRAVTRIALRALLVAGVGFTAIAQDFQNLDFESASVTPPGPAPVLFNSALPGWTGYCGANLQGMVNYNAEYLDSAGISLFDSNCTNEPVQGILHGRYCVCLYSGLLFGTYWGHAATSIAQTGRIPPDARSLLFNFSPSWHWGDQSMHVTFNQFTLPLHEVSAQSNFAVLGCDVSQFAGQIGELQFTAPTGPCECQVYRSIFLLDYIRFSPVCSGQYFEGFAAQPTNLTANVGASISFVAQAIACPSPDLYQWYFEGSPIPEATNSTYQLTNARKADAGSYWAVLSGPGWGLQTSPVITLTVLAEPTVTSAPQSQMAYAGSTLAFQVSASGAAPLAYQWFLNGNALASATGAGLCLTNLQVSQSGLYSLVVTNAFGAATSPPVCLTVVVGPPPTYTVLHHFTGSDGNGPWANLTLSDDTIYGTTVNGGLANSGTVFKVNTNGSGFTVLKRFAGGSDGQIPFGGLTLDGSTLYGTTGGGGTTNEAGTVFKLNTDGSGYAVLQQFNGSDGRQPMCSLLLSNSTLFGTALMGGSSNYGTVFKIGIDGSGFSLLKQFTRADGAFPASGLVLSGTSLYGGTESGGNSQCGVLFGIHPEGTGSTVLKEFSGRDGYGVYGGLVSSGSVLYGTTRYGGAPGLGTVFKIKTDGTGFSVLKTFTTNDAGIDPRGDLTLVGSTLYGTLAKGGDSGCGAVFRIKTDGSGYLVLKRFMGGSDGAFPVGGLTFSGTALYATTQQGGISNCGLIFALSLPVPNILTPPGSQTAEAGTSPVFTVQAEGDPSVTYQWSFNGTNVLGAATTSAFLQLIDVQPPQAGWYTVVVSNASGTVTSTPAMLSVIPVVERSMAPALSLTGQPGSSVSLEYTDALGPSSTWMTLDNVMLTNTSQWYFNFSKPLLPQRFFRARQSGPSSVAPILDLHMVPALTLTGIVGSAVRVDCINQFGPIDAWVTLNTVTLTNTSQLYLDVSAIGQPPRLWQIVAVSGTRSLTKTQ